MSEILNAFNRAEEMLAERGRRINRLRSALELAYPWMLTPDVASIEDIERVRKVLTEEI